MVVVVVDDVVIEVVVLDDVVVVELQFTGLRPTDVWSVASASVAVSKQPTGQVSTHSPVPACA